MCILFPPIMGAARGRIWKVAILLEGSILTRSWKMGGKGEMYILYRDNIMLPTQTMVFMVNNLVFRWLKPLFFIVLGAHGSWKLHCSKENPSSLSKPYSSWVFMGKLSPRIPREPNKYHGCNVRGTPSCPLKNDITWPQICIVWFPPNG